MCWKTSYSIDREEIEIDFKMKPQSNLYTPGEVNNDSTDCLTNQIQPINHTEYHSRLKIQNVSALRVLTAQIELQHCSNKFINLLLLVIFEVLGN